ncbi:MAG: hypothetical protein AAF127_01305 [Pseudomonadota bacterium]
MIRSAFMALASLTLGGCSLIFPEDWRVGEEPVEECIARLNADIDMFDFRDLNDGDGDELGALVPTYTFDITKLPFSRVQELVKPGSDETLGARLMKQFNDNGAAMERFMQWPVDENGAFFFGVKPALFRVRGEPRMHSDILALGCERQGADMRLLRVSVEPLPKPQSAPETETDQDTADTAITETDT